jgi:hypothetical protein
MRWCPFCTRPKCLVAFYSTSSLKQPSVDWHVILIPSQRVFALNAEATNTNFMVFGLQTVEVVDLESAIQMTEVVQAVNSE